MCISIVMGGRMINLVQDGMEGQLYYTHVSVTKVRVLYYLQINCLNPNLPCGNRLLHKLNFLQCG